MSKGVPTDCDGIRRPLRIVITSNTLAVGGAEMQRVTLANKLASYGHKVTLMCLQSLGPLTDSVSSDVAISCPATPSTVAKTASFDVCITGTTNTECAYGFFVTRVRHPLARWIVAIHNPVGPGAPSLAPPARALLRLADVVTALSPEHASAINMLWGISVDAITANGVELDTFEPRLTQKNRKFDIGYVGRLSIQHKGLDLLVEAMTREPCSRLSLAIAGVGDDEQALRAVVRAKGIEDRVKLVGRVLTQEFFEDIRVLAIPSRYEGLPMVALEALSACIPIVATKYANVPVACDLVSVVAEANARDLATTLSESILNSEKSVSDVCAGARLAIETKYSAEAMTQAYLDVINSCLEPRFRRRATGTSEAR